MADIIQIRRDSSANWNSEDPTLAHGEMGFETNDYRFKVGDATNVWSDLEYWGDQGVTGVQGIQGTTGVQGIQGQTGLQGVQERLEIPRLYAQAGQNRRNKTLQPGVRGLSQALGWEYVETTRGYASDS